jgi:hypothetical protein
VVASPLLKCSGRPLEEAAVLLEGGERMTIGHHDPITAVEWHLSYFVRRIRKLTAEPKEEHGPHDT